MIRRDRQSVKERRREEEKDGEERAATSQLHKENRL
jgi:hypothetical protein